MTSNNDWTEAELLRRIDLLAREVFDDDVVIALRVSPALPSTPIVASIRTADEDMDGKLASSSPSKSVRDALIDLSLVMQGMARRRIAWLAAALEGRTPEAS